MNNDLTPYERGEWDMFTLVSSVCFGKEYYFLEPSGMVYSRLSRQYMSREKAIDEFLDYLGVDASEW